MYSCGIFLYDYVSAFMEANKSILQCAVYYGFIQLKVYSDVVVHIFNARHACAQGVITVITLYVCGGVPRFLVSYKTGSVLYLQDF